VLASQFCSESCIYELGAYGGGRRQLVTYNSRNSLRKYGIQGTPIGRDHFWEVESVLDEPLAAPEGPELEEVAAVDGFGAPD
jgi:hypothetical protein